MNFERAFHEEHHARSRLQTQSDVVPAVCRKRKLEYNSSATPACALARFPEARWSKPKHTKKPSCVCVCVCLLVRLLYSSAPGGNTEKEWLTLTIETEEGK